MTEIYNFLSENWTNILAAIGAIYTAASAVALLTPTDKDDTFLDKVGYWADRIGLKLKGK